MRARGPRWRFTLALLASLALHLATLAALSIAEIAHVERSESQPLAVRIAPLAPVAAPEAKAAPARPKRKAIAKPKPLPQAATAALPAPPLAETAAAPVTPAPAETAAAAAAPAETTTADDEAQARAEPAQPEPAVSARPAEPPIAFPERIELEFDLAKNADEAPIGRVVHRFERDGARYVIHSVTAAVGIASLFATGRYVQESRGTLTPNGLQPEKFVVRRGRNERTESAAFDWASSRATVSAGGATKEWTLQAGAQDQLSYLHQLSFLIADPSRPAVTVTNGRRFFRASIEILGWETVATGLGPIKALQVRSQLEGESRIDFWLAPDHGNLPVKLRVRNQRGEEFEQVLAAIKVN
jgi:uncharacterized protein DUF3108